MASEPEKFLMTSRDVPVVTCHLWTQDPSHGHVVAKSAKGRVVLNKDQTEIWLLIDGKTTLSEIEAKKGSGLDVRKFFAELEELGLISCRRKLADIWG